MAENTYQIILKANDETRAAFDSVKNSTNSLRDDLNIIGGSFGAVAATAAVALAAMVKNSIDVADATSKAAQKIGMTTEAFSALKYAAEMSDVSSDSLQKNLAKLASNAHMAATVGGETAETFKKLGVNVKNTDGSLKDSGVLLSELAAIFAKMPDSTEKTALAIKLFGKSGTEMIPMLNSGADGLASMTEEAEKLGLVIDSNTAKRAEALNDNITRLKKASEGFSNELMQNLLPGLADTAEAMVQLTKDGQPVYALLRGFVGIGKVPWDLLFPPEDIGKSLSITNQLKDLKNELASLEANIKRSDGSGLIHKWMYGSKEEMERSAEMIRLQIATIEKHRSELEKKPGNTSSGGGIAPIDSGEANKEVQALLEKSQQMAAGFLNAHKSAYEKNVENFVDMELKLSSAGSAGYEQRKKLREAFVIYMAEEQAKQDEIDQKKLDKETEQNNKLIETQQQKFINMKAKADEASVFEDEREQKRYDKQLADLERERKVLEEKNLFDKQSEDKYNAAKEATHREHLARMEKTSRTFGVSLLQFEKMNMVQRTQTMAQGLMQMTAVGAQNNRALFEINKVASLANATISGWQAVQDAYKFGNTWGGPASGAAMAAIAVAATAANISAIASTEFGGGGAMSGGGGIPSMATAPGVPVAPQSETPPVQGVAAQATREVNIIMSGDAQLFTAEAVRKQLIPAINEAAGDGVMINVRTA